MFQRSYRPDLSGVGRGRGQRYTATGSFIVDGNGTILGFDEAMEAMTGWPAVFLVGRSRGAATRIGEECPPLLDGDIGIPADTRTVPLRIRTADGRTLEVEAHVRRLPGPGDRAQVSILRVLARSAAKPENRGNQRDDLTGLLTAAAFRDRLAHDVHTAHHAAAPLALMLADVDHLRRINDRWGRAVGDRLLCRLADSLRVFVGDDGRIGRIDDDDFAVVLPGAGRGEARQTASALRSSVERLDPNGQTGVEPRVTLSIGAASFPADADNAEDLLARAREALDEARELGRNRVWCYLRRPRVPLEVPVYFDGVDGLLVGYTRDLSPSGIFVQTSVPIDIGMRCALSFPLPGIGDRVHVIGRVVRSVPPDRSLGNQPVRVPGMGVEFERFRGPEDRRAIAAFVHDRDPSLPRPDSSHPSP